MSHGSVAGNISDGCGIVFYKTSQHSWKWLVKPQHRRLKEVLLFEKETEVPVRRQSSH